MGVAYTPQPYLSNKKFDQLSSRYADDTVVLIDGHPRWRGQIGEIRKRMEGELKKVEVELNEEKTREVDVSREGSFGFLGFDLIKPDLTLSVIRLT